MVLPSRRRGWPLVRARVPSVKDGAVMDGTPPFRATSVSVDGGPVQVPDELGGCRPEVRSWVWQWCPRLLIVARCPRTHTCGWFPAWAPCRSLFKRATPAPGRTGTPHASPAVACLGVRVAAKPGWWAGGPITRTPRGPPHPTHPRTKGRLPRPWHPAYMCAGW